MHDLIPPTRLSPPERFSPEDVKQHKGIMFPDPKIIHREGIDYMLITPPHTGSRSAVRFFLKTGLLSVPGVSFVEGDTPEDLSMVDTESNTYLLDHVGHHHSVIPSTFRGKIILTARHPLRRVITKLLMVLYPFRYKDTVTSGDESKFANKNIVGMSEIYDLNNKFLKIEYDDRQLEFGWNKESFQYFFTKQASLSDLLTHYCVGRKPDYVLTTETQENDISLLPFISESHMSSYVRRPKYDKKHKSLVETKAKYLTSYIKKDRAIADSLNQRFAAEIEYFGYEPI